MNDTGYAYSSIKEIEKDLDELKEESQKIVTLRKELLKKDDHYLRSLFLDTLKLAQRFIDLYKENRWKLEREKIDEYLLKNFDEINKNAWKMSEILGKEKHSYLDYNLFKPWESYYALTRDYCNYLTIVGDISAELRKRYFDDIRELKRATKEPGIIIKLAKKLFNIIIHNIPVLKDIINK